MKPRKTKRDRPAKREPPTMRERPKMPPISEEMKQWSAMLKAELIGWPHVTSRPMFGMSGIYRHKRIFAALPVTRGFDTPSSIIFRFDPMPADLNQRALKEPRITPGTRWFSFEIGSAEDLRDALWWLNQAYEAAKK
jgi:hypothetical protein